VTQHAKVYMGARSEAKAAEAIKSLKTLVPTASVEILLMDLSSLSSVHDAAKTLLKQETHLHGIINNAGIMATPMAITADGYEAQLQTNYLSHWLLTYHLTPLLLRTAKNLPAGTVRIVNVTSMGHNFAPKGGIDFEDINQTKGTPFTRYGQSKLGNILHARELMAKYGPEGIWTAATHPGNVDTQLNTQVGGLLGTVQPILAPVLKCLGKISTLGYISVEAAAATPVYAATSADLKSGSYLVPVATVGKESVFAKDVELREKLWSWTEAELTRKGFLD
jgi:NAD(P)-dependent dehydrogenase (short-subunit alcohol dehydrogenase family)